MARRENDNLVALAATIGLHLLIVAVALIGLLFNKSQQAGGAGEPIQADVIDFSALPAGTRKALAQAPVAAAEDLPLPVPLDTPDVEDSPTPPVPQPTPPAPAPQPTPTPPREPPREQQQQREREAAQRREQQQQREREAAQRREQQQREQQQQREREAAQRREQQQREREERERQAQLRRIAAERAAARREAEQAQQRLQQIADRQAARSGANAAPTGSAGGNTGGTGGNDADLRARYAAAIQQAILAQWRRPDNIPQGQRCRIRIRQLPGGEVPNDGVSFEGSCPYDEQGKRSVEAAILRAQPLPYRGFESVFQRTLILNFEARDR